MYPYNLDNEGTEKYADIKLASENLSISEAMAIPPSGHGFDPEPNPHEPNKNWDGNPNHNDHFYPDDYHEKIPRHDQHNDDRHDNNYRRDDQRYDNRHDNDYRRDDRRHDDHRPDHHGERPYPPGDPRPSGPPPVRIPDKRPSLYAIDPGAIRNCMYQNVYIWLVNGSGFWMYPTFVGRQSVSGYRWTRFGWAYVGIDLNMIETFYCVPFK